MKTASIAIALALICVASPAARADEYWPQYDVSRWDVSCWRAAVDQTDWELAERRTRDWIRNQFATPRETAKYSLMLDKGWRQTSADLPVVVLLHGYNSTSAATSALIAPARRAGYPCASFCYPNDHRLAASARFLAKELSEFSRDHPERQIVLLCHSMGSLVARACVEDPALNPGNVARLILVAPPNHGTYLAHLAVGADLWEHWIGRDDGLPLDRLKDSIVDGLGEAAIDLCPGSPFLTELNARERNRDVDYSIILGTAGIIDEEELGLLQQSVRDAVGWIPGIEEEVEDFNSMLAEMEELVEGKGDGVVAVKRGMLAGVDDVVLLPFQHLTVTRDDDESFERDVQKAVLERLN